VPDPLSRIAGEGWGDGGGVPRPSPQPSSAWREREQGTLRPRLPVWLDGHRVGSLAPEHRALLAAHPADFALADAAVHITLAGPARQERLHAHHQRWHQEGVIRAWRGETYALCALHGAAGIVAGTPLLPIERAAARFWGSLTLGAHATGFVRGADGRPALLWIAQRAHNKATDPGRLDNLVGGGVPLGQSAHEALVREAWEEAGVPPAWAATAVPAGVMTVERDVLDTGQWGRQLEWLHSFDLELPAHFKPANQDGEVQGFRAVGLAEALALACGVSAGGGMTDDAALVTRDFLRRHGLG
jgi:8-oxo-dGTP pyrophosphatase MutT (NUDIX family)